MDACLNNNNSPALELFMTNKKSLLTLKLAPKAAGFALATILPFIVSSASAFELNMGGVSGSLDTTLSYGTGWRLEAQDRNYAALYPNYAALRSANKATMANKNDGDANFDNNSDVISSVFKITSDLELKYQDYGVFVRGTAFYDDVIMGERPNRSQANYFTNSSDCNAGNTGPAQIGNCGFPSDIDHHSGRDARFLDAYVYGNFTVADRALNVRLGEQVINWGEALFLQDGINSANPVSLAKLRLPGAEVKEALLPLPMLYGSFELTKALTMEAFYEFDWDYSEPDDLGTYYSTDDAFAGIGASRILVNLGGSTFATNKRISDKSVDNDGQFGVAFRYFAEELNNTEFGLFFMNYHSHKPVAQAKAGQFSAAAGVAAAKSYLDSTTYQLVYPEDIQMYGLSFSTTVGDLSFSGELAYRPNDVILSELGDNLVAYNALYANAVATGLWPASAGGAMGPVLSKGERVTPGTTIKDWVELETYNMSLVAINNFGPTLGADGLMGILELGGTYIPKGEDNRYASTASLLNIPLSAIQYGALTPALVAGACSGSKYEASSCISEGPSNDYLDKFSWGYRAVLTATYNDVFAGVALNPVLRFAHDVEGNSHRTGNFLENRKAATVAVNAVYNNNTEVGLAYNAFWGAEATNFLGDRDNITLAAKYSF